MVDLHGLIARAIVFYYAVLGVWGLFLAVRRMEFSAAYRGALIIGVAVGVVQAAVGLVLVLTVGQPRDSLHYLYGACVIITLPLVASYMANKKFSRVLVYGLASLFMMGLAIRAMTTGA